MFLVNQYKILEKLYPEEADSYKKDRIVVEEGYKLHYDWAVEFLRDGLSEEDCRQVRDILEMFSTIVFAYQKLKDKAGIDKSSIRFPGFDGNSRTEVKKLSYVIYLIDTLESYSELKQSRKDYNSHAPMSKIYSEMLKKWNSFGESKSGLTKEQIIELLEV